MAKGKYTRGPWVAARRRAYRDLSGNSRVILADDKRIAVVHHHNTEEDEANTNLMIAAPDMLEELECLVAQAMDACGAVAEFNAMPCDSLKAKLPTTVFRLQKRIEKARRAIAKAKGEAA